MPRGDQSNEREKVSVRIASVEKEKVALPRYMS